MQRLVSLLLTCTGLMLGGVAVWLFISSSRATVLPDASLVYRGTLSASAPLPVVAANPPDPKPKRAKSPAPARKEPVLPEPVVGVVSTPPVAQLHPTSTSLPVVTDSHASASPANLSPPTSLPAASPPPAPNPPPAVAEYLLISEVFVGSEESGEDEFIVVYNPTQQTINLAGWSISKRTSTGREERLLTSAKLATIQVASRAYITFAHEGSSLPANGVAAYWAKSKTVAAKNNQIILYNSVGAIIDQVSWSEIPKGQVYVREPLMQGAGFVVRSSRL